MSPHGLAPWASGSRGSGILHVRRVCISPCLFRAPADKTSDGRQSAQWRKVYLKAILRQDIGWFDVNNANQLSTLGIACVRACTASQAFRWVFRASGLTICCILPASAVASETTLIEEGVSSKLSIGIRTLFQGLSGQHPSTYHARTFVNVMRLHVLEDGLAPCLIYRRLSRLNNTRYKRLDKTSLEWQA